MAEWQEMLKLLKKTHAKVSLLQSSGGQLGPSVLRRETTEIITKKTIEERIADENDENAGNWFVVNMELKAKLGKQLKKVDDAIDEEELKSKEKKTKKKKVKKKKMVEINAR